NQKWYGDGTELPTDDGKLYLASVLDMGSRRVVGFAIGEHHDAELAYGALAMAVAVRGGCITDVIMHTDRPGQRIHRPAVPRRLHPARGAPVDRPHRVGPGQCGDRIMAFDAHLRAARARALRHQGPGAS